MLLNRERIVRLGSAFTSPENIIFSERYRMKTVVAGLLPTAVLLCTLAADPAFSAADHRGRTGAWNGGGYFGQHGNFVASITRQP